MSRLEIILLGSPQVRLDGASLDTDRRKAVALLAYLAVTARAHTREQLAALLWPDYDRDSALAYLRRTLWELNNALGKDWLSVERDSIAINQQADVWLDTEAFLQLSRRPTGEAAALAEALELYGGDFMAGFMVADTAPFEEWQRQQNEYFRRELGRACERLVEALVQRGTLEAAVPYARRWLALDPLNESAQRAMMRLYAGLGDRAALVRQYEACAQLLKDELGVAPQRETTELYQQLIQAESQKTKPAAPEDADSAAPQAAKPAQSSVQAAARSASAGLHVPALPTPFIGRRPELEQIKTLLIDPAQRLVTLVGPGGTGKTRLSIQAASEIVARFQDGVWFASLASLQSAEGIVPAVAKALDFSFYKEEERPRQQLLEYLWEKELLLILDNFEHLLGNGAVTLVSDILQTAKRVKVLVTSRVRLNVQGEQLYHVKGMRTPDPAAAARWDHPEEAILSFSGLNLFIDRARRVQPAFQLDGKNLAYAAEICRLVEGLPLGIELAAAWLELLTPGEIAAEIRRSLDFLASEAPDLPDRQRSLRAVFESSWKLLDETEQQVFLPLCAFPGSFSREAAQAVSGASLRTLLALANKSWLGQSGEGRYALHPLLRQYGHERLRADEAAWRTAMERMAEYYAGFVEAQGRAMHTAGQIAAVNTVAEEMDGIRAAWEWLVEQGRFQTLIDRLLPGLFHFGVIRGRVEELIALTKRARKAAPVSESRDEFIQHATFETVEVLSEAWWYIFDDHPRERLEELWQQVHTRGLERELGFWYLILVIAYWSGINFEEGARRMQAALDLIESLPERWQVGYGYYWLSASYAEEDQIEERVEYATRSLAISREIGLIHEQGSALQLLGDVAWRKKDYEQGFEYKHAALEMYQLVEDYLSAGYVWFEIGETYLELGQVEQTFQAYQERRRMYERLGNRRMLGTCLSWESLAASRYKGLDEALELRLRSLEISLEAGNQSDIAWHTWELGEVYRLMGDFELAREWYMKALPLFEKHHDAIKMGYFERGFGDMALTLGQWEEARARFQQSLAYISSDLRDYNVWGQAYALSGLGRALIKLDRLEEAEARLRQALDMALRWTSQDIKFLPLLGYAALFAARGEDGKAVELAAFIAKHHASWNETKAQARAVLEQAGKRLGEAEREAAMQRGEKMELETAIAQANQ